MVETAFSSIKRTLGSAVRARSWHLELREMILKCAVFGLFTAKETRPARSQPT
jgi:hypothetical protein